MAKRRRFKAEEKVNILKQRLVEGREISDICDEYGLHPTIFYRWQKQFFDNAELVFQNEEKQEKKWEKKAKKLEAKLSQKNEVLAELMEEHIALKKSLLGED